jgi:hypothetical protein
MQLTVVIWNLPKCRQIMLLDLSVWLKMILISGQGIEIRRTPHIEVEQHILCSPHNVWNYHPFPVLLVIIQFFKSWYEWQQRKIDIVVIFLQDVRQLSLTVFYLWSTVFTLLGLKPGNIHTCTADCIFSTLISINRILLLTIVLLHAYIVWTSCGITYCW